MKRFIRCFSVVMVLVTLLGTVAYAQAVTEPEVAAAASSARSSAFFMCWDSYLYKTSSNSFEVWFDVTAVNGMDELGASRIKVQRSTDASTWTTVKTYYPEDYPSMIEENTGSVYNCVTYTGTKGFFYRAYVVFYAKNSKGIGEMPDYAEVISL